MAIAKKGLRKIVVEGKTFYWKQDSLVVTDENRKFLGYAYDASDYPISNQKFVPGENYEDDPWDYEMANEDYAYNKYHVHPVQIARWIKDNCLRNS